MICEGAREVWARGNVRAAGEVQDIFREPVSRTIDGNGVKRNARGGDPAYLVRQDTGRRVLKSVGEDERGGD